MDQMNDKMGPMELVNLTAGPTLFMRVKFEAIFPEGVDVITFDRQIIIT